LLQTVEDDEGAGPQSGVEVTGAGRRQGQEERQRDAEDERFLPANEALLDELDAGPVAEQLVGAAEEIVGQRQRDDLGLGHLATLLEGPGDGRLGLGALLREGRRE